MWSSDSEHDLAVAAAAGVHLSPSSSSPSTVSPPQSPALQQSSSSRRHRRRRKKSSAAASDTSPRDDKPEPEPEAEDVWRGAQWEAAWPGRHQSSKPVVVLAAEEGGEQVGRSRSLTDDDLEELKGCADLGFGFSYDEIPELRGTLPALELCYSMTQRLLDDHHHHPPQAQPEAAAAAAALEAPVAAPSPPVANWKISSPGDSPDEVKARLKYWAQAVACTVRLCS